MEPARRQPAWEPKALVQRLYAGRVPKVPSPKCVKPRHLYERSEGAALSVVFLYSTLVKCMYTYVYVHVYVYGDNVYGDR